MPKDREPPKTLKDWEQAGRNRFHDDSVPYPTLDTHTPKQEAAFTKGFQLEQADEARRKFMKQQFGEEFDG